MTWTAAGYAIGRDMTLKWDDGPVDWPSDMMTVALGDAGMDIPVSVDGQTRPLNFGDDADSNLTAALWLATQGFTLSGDLPSMLPATT